METIRISLEGLKYLELMKVSVGLVFWAGLIVFMIGIVYDDKEKEKLGKILVAIVFPVSLAASTYIVHDKEEYLRDELSSANIFITKQESKSLVRNIGAATPKNMHIQSQHNKEYYKTSIYDSNMYVCKKVCDFKGE